MGRRKKECPDCGAQMAHVGEVDKPKRGNHSRQLWKCNECGYGPVARG